MTAAAIAPTMSRPNMELTLPKMKNPCHYVVGKGAEDVLHS
jgi:hypothetical protein